MTIGTACLKMVGQVAFQRERPKSERRFGSALGLSRKFSKVDLIVLRAACAPKRIWSAEGSTVGIAAACAMKPAIGTPHFSEASMHTPTRVKPQMRRSIGCSPFCSLAT